MRVSKKQEVGEETGEKGETRLSVVIVITTEAAYQLIRRGGVGGSGGLEQQPLTEWFGV